VQIVVAREDALAGHQVALDERLRQAADDGVVDIDQQRQGREQPNSAVRVVDPRLCVHIPTRSRLIGQPAPQVDYKPSSCNPRDATLEIRCGSRSRRAGDGAPAGTHRDAS